MGERFTDRVALVTGAGLGIGRAVCAGLAAEGATVAVTSRSLEHAEETAREVTAAGGNVGAALALDVGDPAAIERVVSDIGSRLGRIDVLCNNAGIDLVHAPSVADLSDDDWQQVFCVNVSGMFRTTRATLPLMPDGGAIVNVGSINSFVAWPNSSAYSASKGAVLLLSKGMALDLAPRRIRVNCVCPGIIDTPLTRSFIDIADDPDALTAEYDAAAPLGRMGTAEEVANCVLFLASDDASFVTGAALLVDGGTTATA